MEVYDEINCQREKIGQNVLNFELVMKRNQVHRLIVIPFSP